ncbi:MAG: methyl-accepting chemotaxis protein [Oligoflexia bacterium]|nr:methyl-accepting chemotaxis protein [Oligoflexia bacterium]
MQKFHSLPLRSRLLISIIPVLVVTIGILAYVCYYSAANAILNLQQGNLKMMVEKTITALDTWTQDRERDAQTLAVRNVLITATQGTKVAEAEAALRELHKLSPVYENVFLADRNGRLFVDAIGGKSVGIELSQLPPFRENFEQAKKGKVWVGEPQKSPATGRPVSLVTAPILVDGKLIGIVGTPIELNAFSDAFISQFRIGREGHLFILDSTGLSIGHPRKETILKTNFAQTDWGGVFLQKKEGPLRYVLDGLDKTGYFGHSKKKGWIVGSTMPTQELYESVKKIQYISLGLGLLAILVITALITGLTQRIFSVVDRVATTLANGADEVTAASREVFTSGEALAASVAEQAAAVQETSAAVEEITATVQRNADNASKAQGLSASSSDAAKVGLKAVQDTIAAIGEISRSTEQLTAEIDRNNNEINGIVHVITGIADKTKVINDIVFQTKLLSFNASVEAARAGESGKGFAVVAQEVGSLAQMSGNAAKEIGDMLAESVRKVQGVATSTKANIERMVHQGKSKVDQGVKVAQLCGTTLDRVVANVNEVDLLIQEVANASAEQSRGISEIGRAIAELERVNQHNSVAARTTSTASLQLTKQAEVQRTTAEDLLNLMNGEKEKKATTLDFDGALSAHTDWKIKLVKYLANPDRSIDPNTVGRDDQCALGKWLYSDGRAYESLSEYTKLQENHAKFHASVSEIIVAADSGDGQKAQLLMNPNSSFFQCSHTTVELIREMKRKVAD